MLEPMREEAAAESRRRISRKTELRNNMKGDFKSIWIGSDQPCLSDNRWGDDSHWMPIDVNNPVCY